MNPKISLKEKDWYLYNSLMNDFLHDHPARSHQHNAELYNLKLSVDLGHFYFVLTGLKKSMYYPLFGLISESYVRLYFEIEESMKKALAGKVKGFDMFHVYENDSKQIALLFSPLNSDAASNMEIAEIIDHVVQAVYEKHIRIQDTPYRHATAITGPHSGFEGMRQGYKQASALTDLSFFRMHAGIFSAEYIERICIPMDFQEIQRKCYEIDCALGSGNTQLVQKLLKHLFITDLKRGFDIAACNDVLSYLKFSIHLRQTIYGLEAPDHLNALCSISKYYTIEECYEALNDTLTHICDRITKTGSYQMPVQLALYYIKTHCCEDISLLDIARYVNVNPNYLSGLFTQEVGHTIRKEITFSRLEMAKKLLCKSELRVYEIAGKVGIRDTKSFTKLFRTAYGCTPQEYRKHFVSEE